MTGAPEYIGLIGDGLGRWSLATREDKQAAILYVRADTIARYEAKIEALETKLKALRARGAEAAANRYIKALPALNAMRKTMMESGTAHQVVDCLFCGAPAALHVSCAVGRNYHMRGRCVVCEEGFIE